MTGMKNKQEYEEELRMGKGGFCLRTGIQERIEDLGNAV